MILDFTSKSNKSWIIKEKKDETDETMIFSRLKFLT